VSVNGIAIFRLEKVAGQSAAELPILIALKNPIDQNKTVENTTINSRTAQENASYRVLARKIF